MRCVPSRCRLSRRAHDAVVGVVDTGSNGKHGGEHAAVECLPCPGSFGFNSRPILVDSTMSSRL